MREKELKKAQFRRFFGVIAAFLQEKVTQSELFLPFATDRINVRQPLKRVSL